MWQEGLVRPCGILTYNKGEEKEVFLSFFLMVCFTSNLIWTLSVRLWVLRTSSPIGIMVIKVGLKQRSDAKK
jgi:hypothetical protein